MIIHRGKVSQIVPIRILDITSVSGGGKTGLTNTSVNLTAYYHRELDTTATVISLVSTTSGVYLSGGFVESDATHLAGQYELSLPNAAIGSGDASTWVEVMLYDSGSGLGIAPSVLRIDLVAYDPQDATRLGLTALPNANAGATSGLPTRDGNGNVASAPDWSHVTNPTTTLDLSGTTIKNVDNAIANVTTVATTTNLTNAPTAGDFTTAMKTSLNAATPASVTGNVGGNVVGSVGSVTATVAANLTQILGTALTETAGQLAAGFKKWFNVATPTSTMNEITLVDTTTSLTNAAPDSTTITEINSDVDELLTNVAAIPTTPALTSTQTAQAVLNATAASYNIAGSIGALINSIASITVDPATIWNYLIDGANKAKDALAAIYLKTFTSPTLFVSPFDPATQILKLIRGDAYTLANSRQIDLPVPGNVAISAATLLLPKSDGTVLTITGTGVQVAGYWYGRFALLSTDTNSLAESLKAVYNAKGTATADSTTLTIVLDGSLQVSN